MRINYAVGKAEKLDSGWTIILSSGFGLEIEKAFRDVNCRKFFIYTAWRMNNPPIYYAFENEEDLDFFKKAEKSKISKPLLARLLSEYSFKELLNLNIDELKIKGLGKKGKESLKKLLKENKKSKTAFPAAFVSHLRRLGFSMNEILKEEELAELAHRDLKKAISLFIKNAKNIA